MKNYAKQGARKGGSRGGVSGTDEQLIRRLYRGGVRVLYDNAGKWHLRLIDQSSSTPLPTDQVVRLLESGLLEVREENSRGVFYGLNQAGKSKVIQDRPSGAVTPRWK